MTSRTASRELGRKYINVVVYTQDSSTTTGGRIRKHEQKSAFSGHGFNCRSVTDSPKVCGFSFEKPYRLNQPFGPRVFESDQLFLYANFGNKMRALDSVLSRHFARFFCQGLSSTVAILRIETQEI